MIRALEHPKKLHVKSLVHELPWFLRGDTNVKYLDGDLAFSRQLTLLYMALEESVPHCAAGDTANRILSPRRLCRRWQGRRLLEL